MQEDRGQYDIFPDRMHLRRIDPVKKGSNTAEC